MTFTDSNINEIIASGQPVVVDFWATWCSPCMAMAPLVDEIAKEYEGRAVIGKYNCDEENDFATECGIRSLVGGQKADAIRAKVEALLAL